MKSSFFAALAATLLLALSGAARADSYTDFWNAIAQDNARAVSALLAKGMDPNTVSPTGEPALIAALREKHPAVAQVLLDAPGLKPELTNPANEDALMIATIQGNEAAVRSLLERGAKPQRKGWTALHYAASTGRASIAELLIKHGAEVNAQSAAGVTPLMMAARDNHTQMVDELLAAGAKVDLCTDRGLNAAAFARSNGHARLAERLAAGNCA